MCFQISKIALKSNLKGSNFQKFSGGGSSDPSLFFEISFGEMKHLVYFCKHFYIKSFTFVAKNNFKINSKGV